MFDRVKNLFSGGGSDFDGWNLIDEPSKLQGVLEASQNKPQLIYKHSNRCSVCWFAKAELEKASDDIAESVDMHFVDVIRQRDISNHISKNLEVRHESPQAILVDDGQVIWHASHSAVNQSKLLKALA